MTTDPNQLLRELRAYVDGWEYVAHTPAYIQQRKTQPNRPLYAPTTLHSKAAYYDRVMELFQTLDGWLTEGKALPDEWDYSGSGSGSGIGPDALVQPKRTKGS